MRAYLDGLYLFSTRHNYGRNKGKVGCGKRRCSEHEWQAKSLRAFVISTLYSESFNEMQYH